MKYPIYFVSDSHFRMTYDHKEKVRRQKLFNLFSEIKSTGGTLIIGGDFFDFWFDYNFVSPKSYSDIFENLESLRHNGIEIHYVVGNHDYWDFGYFTKKFGAIVHKTDFEFEVDNKKILVTHGDGILKRDNGYRFMKKVIRSKISIFLFKILHPDWGCALANFVSKTSNEQCRTFGNQDEMLEELVQFAKGKWAEGYDTVLMGHYHQTGIFSEDNHKLIHLGDWLKHLTLTKLDENGWTQESYGK
ncbi:MAG: UDP-2,3-diacylglucosamine diphosphatase [Candidatus Marinimicrobia bacterium]|nr:UDP-2,3-diacylglucosamine diphosphatase [Candidatus Neomarinimicrobiota bacterium]MBL7022560.1 UDP-2,3-diacylglucosamine diphosphatase [Candidatus Neomarinimicrobiota bacterium]MBL7108916.1 UDP-2,3-diacylglucosamine diphosphatase [Candidatus Neomarinimicrobiota bacterium]